MGTRWMSRSAVAIAAASVSLLFAGAALAVTPGWECVPTAAGQAVVSGGTGSAPSCGAGTTAVLAPTYVSTGVGGKHTVQFAAVNVQILNGAGSTASVNGTGNLVVGYDENPGALAQSGSHDLILGRNHSFTGVADLVGGFQNTATGNYAAVLGAFNTASGTYATVTGGQNNAAKNTAASVAGGAFNTAAGGQSTVTGGCSNLAGMGTVSVNSACTDTTAHPTGYLAVT